MFGVSHTMDDAAVPRDDLLSVDQLDVDDASIYSVGRCIVSTVYLNSGVANA